MTKRQALRALNSQRHSLTDKESLNDSIWLGQTKDYFSALFGLKSEKYILISSFHPYSKNIVAYGSPKDPEDDKRKIDAILLNAIDSIYNDAFLKNVNFLMQFSNKEIISGIVGAATIIVGITVFIMTKMCNCPTT